jgi:hypothetical protein
MNGRSVRDGVIARPATSSKSPHFGRRNAARGRHGLPVMNETRLPFRAAVFLASLAAATALWVPSLHFFFDGRADPGGRASTERELMDAQLALWEDGAQREGAIARMRGANAEWDFMGRTYLVLALADAAIAEGAHRERNLAIIDRILEETIALDRERGQAHFLMAYVRYGRFVDPSARSIFVDGEIALMLAARQRVEESERWRTPLAERVAAITAQMERGAVLSAESYPNECWTFCNAMALAAIRTSDSVTGDDHSQFFGRWIATARERLIDPETGMLVSSFQVDGTHMDGPEGSSIFMVAHLLRLIDPVFAADQYARARRELGVSFAGFAWAREWPSSWGGPADIDSGPIVPIVDASAGASGLALLGAASFGDEEYLAALHRSLALAAFPVHEDGRFRYAASNQVGDAVLLYSLSRGALWHRIGAPEGMPQAARGRNVGGEG